MIHNAEGLVEIRQAPVDRLISDRSMEIFGWSMCLAIVFWAERVRNPPQRTLVIAWHGGLHVKFPLGRRSERWVA